MNDECKWYHEIMYFKWKWTHDSWCRNETLDEIMLMKNEKCNKITWKGKSDLSFYFSVLCLLVCFIFVLCLLDLMLSVSLDCPFLISSSASVALIYISIFSKQHNYFVTRLENQIILKSLGAIKTKGSKQDSHNRLRSNMSERGDS